MLRSLSLIQMGLAFLCLGWAGPSGASSEVARFVAAGVAAVTAGKPAEARMAFQKALNLEPANVEANLRLGLLLNRSGDLAGAREAFRRAVKADPNTAEGHLNLGLSLVSESMGKRDWPAAMVEFRTALGLKPNDAEAHRLLGLGLSEMGQRDQAVAELRLALAARPDSAEGHLALGKALEEEGELPSAEQQYREALRLHPEATDAGLALGKLLAGGSEKTAALGYLRSVVQQNPDSAAAQYALAKVLQQTGRQPEAAVAFQEAAALTKRQADAVQCTRLSNEGLDAAHRGDLQEASRLLRSAVALRPDAAVPHYNLALVLADRGDLVHARAQAVQAISLQPVESRFYLALGRMWKRSGEPKQAVWALVKAAALDPGDAAARTELRGLEAESAEEPAQDRYAFGAPSDTADGHFEFATFLTRQGDWTGAIGEWLRALALRPAYLDARNNLAVSYARAGLDNSAELEFRKILQVAPEAAAAHFGLAMLDLDRGKAGAVEELREVVRLQPDYPQAKTLLAAALAQGKQ